MNVMKGNTRYVIDLLPSKDVISYKHDCSRGVRRTVAKIFRGFSAAGFGVHVDLSPLFEVGAESTSNTMNALLRAGLEQIRLDLQYFCNMQSQSCIGVASKDCIVDWNVVQ